MKAVNYAQECVFPLSDTLFSSSSSLLCHDCFGFLITPKSFTVTRPDVCGSVSKIKHY